MEEDGTKQGQADEPKIMMICPRISDRWAMVQVSHTAHCFLCSELLTISAASLEAVRKSGPYKLACSACLYSGKLGDPKQILAHVHPPTEGQLREILDVFKQLQAEMEGPSDESL